MHKIQTLNPLMLYTGLDDKQNHSNSCFYAAAIKEGNSWCHLTSCHIEEK